MMIGKRMRGAAHAETARRAPDAWVRDCTDRVDAMLQAQNTALRRKQKGRSA